MSSAPNTPQPRPADCTVRARQLSHGFSALDAAESDADSLKILDGLSLEIMAGESVAIVGPSGAGKSTLLGLLAGLDEPQDGDIELLGQSLKPMSQDQRAALRAGRVGFVFQSFQLLPALTALENVLLPLELGGVADAKQGPKQEAEQALAQVGLAQRHGHLPHQLSGGEQQRVALARAFAARPKVLFADEPTGNLDRATGTRIAELMFRLQSEQGSSLVLVTHDPNLAQACDRVLTLEQGRLVSSS